MLRGDLVAAGKGGLTFEEPAAVKPISDKERDLYMATGKKALEAGEYDLAIANYKSLRDGASDDPLTAASAAHAVARAQFKKTDYEAAIRTIGQIENNYAETAIVAPSLLLQAQCEHLLWRNADASHTLLKIRQTYPDYFPDEIEKLARELP